MIHLRPPQAKLETDIYNAWNSGNRNVLAVAPTGFGKTVLFSKVLHDHQGAAVAIAHRQELISQISLSLARNGVRHGIIAPSEVCRIISRLHIQDLGASFYDPQSPKRVAGINSLCNLPSDTPWLKQVTMYVGDEFHHYVRGGLFGKGLDRLPNARGLGVTATPNRADGKGLGRSADGVIDVMVKGPPMRTVIDDGYLTDYRVICAQASDLVVDDLPVGPSGEFNYERVRDAVHKSRKIVGDVVECYLRYARGKLGVTFAVDVEEATKIAIAFRAAGVPSEVVTAKTPILLRAEVLRRFRRKELLQLVNVDLFGEGFDLPAVEVVSMARPTMSFPLFTQQFGRMLRLLLEPRLISAWGEFSSEQRLLHIAASEKPYGLLIDHVGNILRHGVPDSLERYERMTLDRKERRASSLPDDVEPLRVCANPNPEAVRMTTHAAGERSFYKLVQKMGEGAALAAGLLTGPRIPCAQPFRRFLRACPHCGYAPEPAERSTPEQVEGDLQELSPEALARMRGAIDAVGEVRIPFGASDAVRGALQKRARERIAAQEQLRAVIALWGGVLSARGQDTSEQQRRFFYKFGVDVGTAQTLAAKDAINLMTRVQKNIDDMVNIRLQLTHT